MEANELRIGNYVYCNFTTNQPDKIDTIDLVDFDIINTKDGNMENYKPIPLTEEILLKCGFDRDRDGWYLSAEYKLYNPLNPMGMPSGKYYIMTFHDKIIAVKATIYLHQLQNLYFALTGNELTVSL